jgi:molecular chaperone IbpA
VGFDRIFDRLVEIENHPARQTQSGFPPYNIRASKDELKFSIELALAGLSDKDVDIEVKENQLTIKSVYDTDNNGDDDFVHKGISKRKFTRSFTLADDIEVVGASFKDGLLTIGLERIIPDHKKPQKIKIDNKKEFLVE